MKRVDANSAVTFQSQKFALLLLVCGAWTVSSVTAEEPAARNQAIQPDPRLCERLQILVKERKLPGLVAGIVHGESLIAVGAAGVRKNGSPEPITIHDQMHLGSCTKAMTATRIAMLIESGQLKWDSTLAGVFPEEIENVHVDYHGVTLMQLLSHRGSVPANPPWKWMVGEVGAKALSNLSLVAPAETHETEESTTKQRVELLKTMLKEAPRNKPGTSFEYSNFSYMLAAAMAERVTGRSWEDLMREDLFQPLGMVSAGFGIPGRIDKVEQPWGHLSRFGSRIPVQADNPPALGPAGTVHASIPDWSRFAALHLQGARGHGQLLKPETFKVLHTPLPETIYTCGWVVSSAEANETSAKIVGGFFHQLGFDGESPLDWTGGRVLTHNGSNSMWYSLIVILPERDLAFVVATNRFDKTAEQACGKAVREMLNYFETELSKAQ